MDHGLIIIADDLTGAADAAAVCARAAPASVVFDTDDTHWGHDAPIAVDTDSRHASPAQAAARVEAAVACALSREAPIYKKIDSILRGNTAVEIVAALSAFRAHPAARAHPRSALVAAAFPGTGRTVRDGVVHVAGHALADGRGDIAALLSGHGVAIAHLGLDTVRGDTRTFVSAYRALASAGADIVVVDAETAPDLDAIQRAAAILGPAVLAVGSAGLVAAIAACSGPCGRAGRHADRQTADGAVVAVIGSYSDVARCQQATLTTAGMSAVALQAPFGAREQQQAEQALRAHIGAGDVLLSPDPDAPIEGRRAPAVAAALAALGSRLLRTEAQRIVGLIAAGGETARALLQSAGVNRLSVQGEIEPGVVFSVVPQLDGLPLITKAGGFGDAGTLERARQALHRPPAPGVASQAVNTTADPYHDQEVNGPS